MKNAPGYLVDALALLVCIIGFAYCADLLAQPSPRANTFLLRVGEGLSLVIGLVALVSIIVRGYRQARGAG